MNNKLIGLKRALFFNWDKVYQKFIDKPWSECEQHILNKLTPKAKHIIKTQYRDRITPYKGEVTERGLVAQGPWGLRHIALKHAEYYIDKDNILRYYIGAKAERKKDYYSVFPLLNQTPLYLFKEGATYSCIHYEFNDREYAPRGLYILKRIPTSLHYEIKLDRDGQPMFDEQGKPLLTPIQEYKQVLTQTTLKGIGHLLSRANYKYIKDYYEQSQE
jgi:hypothetical protein